MLNIKFKRNFHLQNQAFTRISGELLNNFGSRTLGFLKRYPPQRNLNTRYVRGYGVPPKRTSEDLGARWNKKLTRQTRKQILTIGNNASYAQWVQARFMQAEIHQGWWQTEGDMTDQLFPTLIDEFDRFLPQYIVSNRQ